MVFTVIWKSGFTKVKYMKNLLSGFSIRNNQPSLQDMLNKVFSKALNENSPTVQKT